MGAAVYSSEGYFLAREFAYSQLSCFRLVCAALAFLVDRKEGGVSLGYFRDVATCVFLRDFGQAVPAHSIGIANLLYDILSYQDSRRQGADAIRLHERNDCSSNSVRRVRGTLVARFQGNTSQALHEASGWKKSVAENIFEGRIA